uniref:Uncharacterized protein n=1 Tax=Arundo donax TaxID=35708 RepID=A0A0A9F7J9_ARUDO
MLHLVPVLHGLGDLARQGGSTVVEEACWGGSPWSPGSRRLGRDPWLSGSLRVRMTRLSVVSGVKCARAAVEDEFIEENVTVEGASRGGRGPPRMGKNSSLVGQRVEGKRLRSRAAGERAPGLILEGPAVGAGRWMAAKEGRMVAVVDLEGGSVQAARGGGGRTA